MAKSIVSLPILCLLLLLSSNSVGLLKLTNGQARTWCVAKPSSNDTILSNNIDYACSRLGMRGYNCSMIQEHGVCYYPNILINHASFAMNYYYQIYGHASSNCYFDDSALLTISDPSYGSCHYALGG